MTMQLLLVAFTVCIGLSSVQSRSEAGSDQHGIRENMSTILYQFRNLFNSINKNDMMQTDTYRNALEQETAREKEAFNTMKEAWRYKRQRNFNEHRGLGRAAAVKREAEKPVDVSNGRPVNVGLVQECLEEMKLGDKTIDQLSPVQLGELKGKVDAKHMMVEKYGSSNNTWITEHAKLLGERDQLRSDRDQLQQTVTRLEKNATALEKDLENVQKEVRKFKGFTWKIVPRVFFDDIESLYKPRYDKYNDDRRNEEQKHKLDHVTRKMTDKPKYVPLHTTPADYPDGRDPRAVRMRQKYDFWDWLTTQHADDDTVKKILEKMEKKFRSMEKPPIPEERELTEEEKGKLEKFRKKTCKAIGFASESASFILHGYQAVELFEGELEHLNIYGDEVDPYLVPVLNAVAPLTKEGVEPATFMKTE